MPKAKQTKTQLIVPKTKPSKPKTKRNYDKARVVRKTGARTKANIVKSAASNLAHARWSVTPKEYQLILKKQPVTKINRIKPKPLTKDSNSNKRSAPKVINVSDKELFGIPKIKRKKKKK